MKRPTNLLALLALAAVVIFVFIWLSSSTPSSQFSDKQPEYPYSPGEYYAVNIDGDHRVVKVIIPWDETVVLTLYKNEFELKPNEIDPAELYLYEDYEAEARKQADGLPVKFDTFESWDPELLPVLTVNDLEQENFDYWKEAESRWYFPEDYPLADSY